MTPDDPTHAPAEAAAPATDAARDYDIRRRDVLARLGKVAGYAAPVTVAMLSMKASACSMTC